MIEGFESARPDLEVFRRNALIVGVVALAIGLIGAFLNPAQFFRSYLLGFLFCIGVRLGCFAVLLVQHMSGGVWGLVPRRVLESATRTFPLLALLFVPFAAGTRLFFPGAGEVQAGQEAFARAIAQKHISLNLPFFLVR